MVTALFFSHWWFPQCLVMFASCVWKCISWLLSLAFSTFSSLNVATKSAVKPAEVLHAFITQEYR